MRTGTYNYGEALLAVLNESAEIFEAEARMAMAVKLYELGRLTSGQAAELAGLGRVDFLLSCQRFGTASVAWDDEELAREESNL